MTMVSASGVPLTSTTASYMRLLQAQALAMSKDDAAGAAELLFSAGLVSLCERYAPPVALRIAEAIAAEVPAGVRNMLIEKGLL